MTFEICRNDFEVLKYHQNISFNIVVETKGLTINEVAQIKEIVYLECGVIPDNIKIIEKSEI